MSATKTAPSAAEFHCWYAQTREEALEKGKLLLDLYGKYLKPGPVIDMGCGEGALLLSLQQMGIQPLLGIESNPSLIRLASSLGVPVVESDLLEYFRNKERKPAVFFYLDVIEHVPYEFNVELFGLLPVGSRLILQTPYTRSLHGHEMYFNVPSHVAPYSPWIIDKMLLGAGYQTVAQGSIGGNRMDTWKNKLRQFAIRKLFGIEPELLMGGGNYFVVADRVRQSQ